MKKLTGNQTRALFLEYFKKQGHMVEPSASLIPHDDPRRKRTVVPGGGQCPHGPADAPSLDAGVPARRGE